MKPENVASRLRRAADAAEQRAWRKGTAQILVAREGTRIEETAQREAASQRATATGFWGISRGTSWILWLVVLVAIEIAAGVTYRLYSGRSADPAKLEAVSQAATDPNSGEALRALRSDARLQHELEGGPPTGIERDTPIDRASRQSVDPANGPLVVRSLCAVS
jgi:hypothetical protein